MIIVVMGVCGCGKTTIGEGLSKQLGWGFADADEFHSPENKSKMSQGLPLTDEDRYPWLLAIHNHIQRVQSCHHSEVVTCSALKYAYRDILRHGSDSQLIPQSLAHTIDTGDKTRDKHNTGSMYSTIDDNVEESIQTCQSSDPSIANYDEDMVTEVGNNDTVKVIGNESVSNDTGLGCGVVFVHLTGQQSVLQSRLDERKGHFMPAALLQSQLDTLEPLTSGETGLEVDIDQASCKIVQKIVRKLKL